MKSLIFLLALLVSAQGAADGEHHPDSTGQEKLGAIDFPISCSPAAQGEFNRAVAMLHSFWYEEANKTFRRIAESDPDCAMAYWGAAMSLYRQLWATPPTEDELHEGRDALQKAKALSVKTEREQLYLAALDALYRSEEPAYGKRKLAYEQAMAKVLARFPDDLEAAVFYALALISTAAPQDKTYAKQKNALALLQKVLDAVPNHPGVAHYLIHASDNPELASLGLAAARSYARIAPVVPHALHMPSHIFIRLGLWQDAADSNLAAYRAARDYARSNFPGKVWDQQLHYMDYMLYAYLQSGQFDKAETIWRETAAINKTHPDNTTSAYALAAIPARYAVERRAWSEAARLGIRPLAFPWEKFGWCEAVTHFAKGLGAARSGDPATARASLRRLEALRDAAKVANNTYAADQIEIQRLAVAAWLAHADKQDQEAERLMRASADLEDATEKDNVTPGAIIPARELLGDLLLNMRKPKQALKEYKASLQRTPNRMHGLQGAEKAAQAG
ncbi:hypothetical protein [Methylomicrobium lacus]|uniref:hypothetical protein n=1 Tax=Methylomicrobium lacus TaxID=136992 RepID=UPI0035A94037